MGFLPSNNNKIILKKYIMTNIKTLETIQIEGTTEKEVQELINIYISKGYELEQEICISDDKKDEYPYFAYVIKNEF